MERRRRRTHRIYLPIVSHEKLDAARPRDVRRGDRVEDDVHVEQEVEDQQEVAVARRVRPGVRQGNNKKNDRAQRHEERELEGVRDVDGAVGRRVDRPRQAQRDEDVEDVGD